MRHVLLAIALILVSLPALGDEGELGLVGIVGVEGTTARHPKGLQEGAPLTVTPALVAGGGVHHGLTNVFNAGLGLEAAFAGNVTTPRAAVGGATGDLVTGLVLDLRLPAAFGAHLDTGLPVSTGLVVETGPSLTLWSSSALVDPARKDPGGPPSRLPVTVSDDLVPGAFVRIKLRLFFHPFDALSIVVEPHLALAWSSRAVLAFGVTLQPRWTPSIGPL